MVHPLLHLIATRPQLLAEHAEAYAELVASEFGTVSSGWKRRALLNAAALCGTGVGAVLGGVALMLWAVIPATQIQAPWALVVAPVLPLAAAACCAWAARIDEESPAFESVRRQLRADVALLREVGAA